jgi:hypothetical protein
MWKPNEKFVNIFKSGWAIGKHVKGYSAIWKQGQVGEINVKICQSQSDQSKICQNWSDNMKICLQVNDLKTCKSQERNSWKLFKVIIIHPKTCHSAQKEIWKHVKVRIINLETSGSQSEQLETWLYKNDKNVRNMFVRIRNLSKNV